MPLAKSLILTQQKKSGLSIVEPMIAPASPPICAKLVTPKR
jgi:hypothetical protein